MKQVDFLLGLLFDPENGSDMFFRNVNKQNKVRGP
jgi:hypothetical protein